MFKRIYLEITDVCNLACSFCHGTKRAPRFLTPSEFRILAERLRGYTEYLYFHLMGEPLLHPQLDELLAIAGEQGFQVNLTTNGTLLDAAGSILLASPALHRVNLSLQCWEANPPAEPIEQYISRCAAFARQAAAGGILVSLRLWNGGGAEQYNSEIVRLLERSFPRPWKTGQKNTVLAPRIYLEYGALFDWPDPDAPESGTSFCHGLRDHLGVLCDGTVVPCCLDAEGSIALGNLFSASLDEILAGPRAVRLYDGFSCRRPVESLCLRCGYAARF